MHPADSNYEITLDSNRTIALDELHQHLTYAGLLEGLPTRRINKDILLEIFSSDKSCFIEYCLSSSLLYMTTFFGDKPEISFTN